MKRLLVLLAACGGPVHPRVTLVPPAMSSQTPPTTSPDLCKRVSEQQNEKVNAAIIAARRESPDEWTPKVEAAVGDAFATMGISCHAFATGAWSVEPRSFILYPQWKSASAELIGVLYVRGQRYESTDAMRGGYGAMFTNLQSALASDYDHDGIPELWLFESVDGPEGGHYDESKLLTFAHDKVVPYVSTESAEVGEISQPRDVDGDGVLDLPVTLGIHLGEGSECAGKSGWSPATFLAHALPNGTFSIDDAVAKAYVKSWCPGPPAKIATPENALCARLWKMPRTVVTSSCAVWDCDRDANGKPQAKGATRDCEDRATAYDVTVPFTLP